MTDIPVLETERLILRAPTLNDLDAYTAFRSSERARFVGGPNTRTECFDKLGEIIGHWQLRGFGRWMVADKNTDEPMGVVGMFYPDDWPEAEIAWSVFENGEGKGIAFEASMAARDYAYNTMNWKTAISAVSKGNDRSVALAKRMGATYEGDYLLSDAGPLEIYRHPSPEDLI